jgi:hypothetical protein
MKRASNKQTAAEKGFANEVRPNANANGADGMPSDAAIFLQSLQDTEIIERVRATIQNAHVFKLPKAVSLCWLAWGGLEGESLAGNGQGGGAW